MNLLCAKLRLEHIMKLLNVLDFIICFVLCKNGKFKNRHYVKYLINLDKLSLTLWIYRNYNIF